MTPSEEFLKSLKMTELTLRCIGVDLRLSELRRSQIVRLPLPLSVTVLLMLGTLCWLVERSRDGITFVEVADWVPKLTLTMVGVSNIAVVKWNKVALAESLRRLQRLYEVARVRQRGEEEARTLSTLSTLNVIVLLTTYGFLSTAGAIACSPGGLMALHYWKTGEFRLISPIGLSYGFHWDVYHTMPWAVAYLHSSYAGGVIAVTTVGLDTLIFAYCTLLDVTWRSIHLRLQGLYDARDTAEPAREAVGDDSLTKIIAYHQELIASVREFDNATRAASLVFVIGSTFLICFCSFLVVVMKLHVVQFGMLLGLSVSQILVFSYYGQKVRTSSEMASEAAWASAWPRAAPAERRMLQLLIARSQRPCSLTVYKFGDVGLNSFTAVMSRAWSYFALLNSLYE